MYKIAQYSTCQKLARKKTLEKQKQIIIEKQKKYTIDINYITYISPLIKIFSKKVTKKKKNTLETKRKKITYIKKINNRYMRDV